MTLSIRIRRRLSRIGITAAAAAGIGIAILLGSIWYALEEFAACRNEVLSSTRSPDGTVAVFVFRQACNATVPDSMYAGIAPTDRPFSPDRNRAFFGVVGNAEVLSSWRGNDLVEIALIPGRERDFIRHEARVGGVRIDYK